MKKLCVLLMLLALGAWAADELQLTVGWQYNKNDRKRILSPAADKFDVSGNGVVENVQTISTNATGDALILGGVVTPGFAWFHNTDTSRVVTVGSYDVNTNFLGFLELRAGQKAACWLSTTAPRARATAAAVKLDYIIVDR